MRARSCNRRGLRSCCHPGARGRHADISGSPELVQVDLDKITRPAQVERTLLATTVLLPVLNCCRVSRGISGTFPRAEAGFFVACRVPCRIAAGEENEVEKMCVTISGTSSFFPAPQEIREVVYPSFWHGSLEKHGTRLRGLGFEEGRD